MTGVNTTEQDLRFEFGKNWTHFLRSINDDRIAAAEASMTARLELDNLVGRTFLDVGSGSGLFSLAARRLGATVHSFDYDPNSVACTRELRRRYYPDDPDWSVERGSVLDRTFLSTLGTFDVVYSWGVLHHTGHMWDAFENVVPLVAPNGRLFISIYNDQGLRSRGWRGIKRLYNRSPVPARTLLVLATGFAMQTRSASYRMAARLYRLARPRRVQQLRREQEPRSRAMTVWNDLVDWVGGYPFEVAKPEEVFRFFRSRGFVLTDLKTCGGHLDCNEYVFVRSQRGRDDNLNNEAADGGHATPR